MSTREAWSTATTEQMHRLRGKGRQETTAAGDHGSLRVLIVSCLSHYQCCDFVDFC